MSGPRVVIVTGGRGYDGKVVESIGDVLDSLHSERPLAKIAPLDVPIISPTMVALERWVMQKRVHGYRLPMQRLAGSYEDFIAKARQGDADVVVMQLPVASGGKPAIQVRDVVCVDVAAWALERGVMDV